MDLAGKLLVALPLLDDPNFGRTIVLLLNHGDEDGVIGVVLNRPSTIAVADLLPSWDGLAAEPAVVFIGGPVKPDVAIALGVGPAIGLASIDLHGDPALADVREIRVFAGYAGWSIGQLEGEIAEGAWTVVDAGPDDAFSSEPGDLWSTVLRRQPGTLAWMANLPEDISVN